MIRRRFVYVVRGVPALFLGLAAALRGPVAFACLVYGAWLIARPAGLIVAGLLLLLDRLT